MEIHRQLAFGGEPLHRFALPDGRVALDVIADLRRQHEKAAVYPGAVADRLFLKAADDVAFEADCTVAPRRLCCRHGSQAVLSIVKFYCLANVHVTDPVAVGDAKGRVGVDVGEDSLDPTADHRFLAGVDQRDRPRLGFGLVYGQIVFAEIDGDVGHVKEVVDEIFFDHVAAVAEADDEFVDAVGRVDFHDVPKNRLAADLDHRFWLDIRFLGEARAQPAGQQDRFHSPTTSTSVSSLFPVFPVLRFAAATHSADAVDCNLSALCRSTQRHVTLEDCLAADASRGVQGHVCGRLLSLFLDPPIDVLRAPRLAIPFGWAIRFRKRHQLVSRSPSGSLFNLHSYSAFYS